MTNTMGNQSCNYWSYGRRCDLPSFSGHKCTLHAELPEDYEEFVRLKKQKNDAVKKKLQDGDFDFEGAIVFFIDLSREHIQNLNFKNATLKEGLSLPPHVRGHITFEGATFEAVTHFDETTFEGYDASPAISFEGAIFKGLVSFNRAVFACNVLFRRAIFEAGVTFINTTFKKEADFSGAVIEGGATFLGATFEGDFFPVYPFDVKGSVSCEVSINSTLKARQAAYRTAKQSYEALGKKKAADQYFYHEMAARRQRKPWYLRYPESVVQYGFWYGTHPFWLLGEFAVVWLIFGTIFWLLANGLGWAALSFSFLTIIIPGYGILALPVGASALLTSAVIVETAIGAFTWPTFIVIFARNFVR